MLRDGKFIKEKPVRVGEYWTPTPNTQTTLDEELIQEALLAQDTHFWTRLLRKMVAV